MAKKESRHAELVSASQIIDAPYELPKGWKWTRLGDVAKFIGGGTPDKSNKAFWNGNISWASVKDIKGDFLVSTEDTITEIGLNESSSTLCEENGLILVTRISPGKAIIAKIMTAINQDLKIVQTSESKQFMKLFFDFYEEEIKRLSSGTTVKGIRLDLLQNLPFPLPPITEQQRIVIRIESMFAKLDEAKEKAQNVVDSFETRKAAILHQAFTGNLTAKWRKENGVSDDSWEEKTVGDCCSEVKVGIVIKPTRYYTDEKNGIPAFRSANVRENHIDNFDWVYINDEGMKNEQRSIVHTNDVLVVRSGAPGTACVVTEQFDGYNAIDILIAVPLPEVINSYFLCYYTNSPMGKNIVAEKKRGLGLTHFNVKGYSATPIKVPSLPEQQEIVRILDTVLEKESTAKSAAEQVLEQIDLLKKSILARAFRGKL